MEPPSPASKKGGPFSFSEGHYTLRLAPEVFGVSVEVQKGKIVRISIREGEDPRAAVTNPNLLKKPTKHFTQTLDQNPRPLVKPVARA